MSNIPLYYLAEKALERNVRNPSAERTSTILKRESVRLC